MQQEILGLIGKGKWGQNYINTIQKLNNCKLPSNYIKTRDYSHLLKQTEINGIIIASPTSTHFEIARQFLIHGFNLLIEKPVTTTYQEALELQDLQKKHKVSVVMIGHIQIYDPGYQELIAQLDIIGKPHKMEFNGLQSPVRHDSTVIENWGPHPIYLFMDIADKKPLLVSALQTTDDNIRLEFDFGDQLVGIANIGSISPEKKRQLIITGTDGSLTLDWSSQTKILYFTDTKGIPKNISFDTIHTPLELEVLEFINCIKTGNKSKTPLSQGIEVMKIIEVAQNSIH